MAPLIAITGPMGSGKTTLGRSLADYGGYVFLEETFEDNPYLQDATLRNKHIYENINWFINSDYQRYRQACELTSKGIGVVIDKPFFEEYTYIAISNLTETQKMLCHNLISDLASEVRKPDILIDLQIRSKELARRISARGREFESSVELNWLKVFKETHKFELSKWPDMLCMPLDAEAYDFRNGEHVEIIYKRILEVL